MRALVVDESMFGNTEAVAHAIVAGLAAAGVDVELRSVNEAAESVGGYDLVVVGAPTHALGLSRASTRQDAFRKGADDAAATGIGVREWIEALAPAPDVVVATFDTRVRHPRVPGSAARSARKRLRGKGFRAADPAMTFWVEDVDGPLLDGELERAGAWATDLAMGLRDRRVIPD
jgi:flavodoxin